LKGNVELREALGSELVVHFVVPGATPAMTEDVAELARDAGTADLARVEGKAKTIFVGKFGARAHITEGEPVEVAVDTSALHFFDLETGLGIYGDNSGEKGATT
jgi:multiple sugar transport system ATP-binding protein